MSGGTTNSTTETSLSCMPDVRDRFYGLVSDGRFARLITFHDTSIRLSL